MDQPFAIGLLLKPVIGLIVLAVVFGIPILLVRLIRPIFPSGRLKDVLFRERGGDGPALRPDSKQGVLDNPPLLRREHAEDAPRF